MKNFNNILTNFLEDTKFWGFKPMSNKQNDEILEDQFENCGKCTELEFANSHEVGCDCSCHVLPEEGLRDAYDLQNDADNKLLNNLEESEKNNNYK